ncbi:hypothetical protein SAMN05421665_3052 [Yoonia rosea]|uniref:Membrane-anchored ribosome-binding protein, inhibits growth in stationary phase, ElaB/YqjD/DUF883 family n=1 Tax=Yoonia rosea TaxID=287098 RepID=A0A1R3XJ48_9RHOB|nr:hypothetical protein [Yoonia rosea]SIT90284.1 hypothetical protein SAMN05421665_3052 [Yoonia rosea]
MTSTATIEKNLEKGVNKKASAIKERATKTVEKGVEAAQDTFEQAAFQAELATEQAGEELRKLTASGTKFVRDNPGTAVVGAVGLGILVGLALRSRD